MNGHLIECISCKKNFLPSKKAVSVIRIGKNNHTNYMGTRCKDCVEKI